MIEKIDQLLKTEDLYKNRKKMPNQSAEAIKNILKNQNMEILVLRLAREGQKIWRFAKESVPFDEKRWKETLEKSWSIKGTFPVLYHEKAIYDCREVVVCFLITCGMSMNEADSFLNNIAVKNQSYIVRKLYSLHYKESFFRLIMSWNDVHAEKISFCKAIELYEHYERMIVSWIFKERTQLNMSLEKLTMECFDKEWYQLARKYQDLYEPLCKEMEKWKFPFSFYQQDQIQRMIVLLAHVQRALLEEKSDITGKSETFIQKNSYTRPAAKRGTMMAMNVIEECKMLSSINEAIDKFLELEIPVMGEAYWRAVSQLLDLYSQSGGSIYKDSLLTPQKINSYRSKSAKKYCKVSIFNVQKQDEMQHILSYAFDVEMVIREIKKSSNTVLIASLMRPANRKTSDIFSTQRKTVNQTTLSLLLNNYILWCEGKTTISSQGEKRLAMPYYSYKRDSLVKYGLACGCISRKIMGTFLELSGSPGLSDYGMEYIVKDALKYYEETGGYIGKGQYLSPIQIILVIQEYWLFYEAMENYKRISPESEKKVLRRCVHDILSFRVYEPDLSLSKSADMWTTDSDTKQNFIEKYLTMRVVFYMLLCSTSDFFSFCCQRPVKKTKMAKYIMQLLIMESSFLSDHAIEDNTKQDYYDFILFLVEPMRLAENYIDELEDTLRMELDQEYYHWRQEYPLESKLQIYRQQIEFFLKAALNQLGSAKNLMGSDNPMELKYFLEEIFYVLSGIQYVDNKSRNLYGMSLLSQQALQAFRKIREKVQQCSVHWAFIGGCRNFTIAYYEKEYQLNYFSKEHKKINHSESSRWRKHLENIENIKLAFTDIRSDIMVLGQCYTYLCQEFPEFSEFYHLLAERLHPEMDKIRDILDILSNELGDSETEKEFSTQLEFIRKHMF